MKQNLRLLRLEELTIDLPQNDFPFQFMPSHHTERPLQGLTNKETGDHWVCW
jgi:hypothetical protein